MRHMLRPQACCSNQPCQLFAEVLSRNVSRPTTTIINITRKHNHVPKISSVLPSFSISSPNIIEKTDNYRNSKFLCSRRRTFSSDNVNHNKDESIKNDRPRPRSRDPMAQRPTKVCDPYGQNGRPLEYEEASNLMSTLCDGWFLQMSDEIDSDATRAANTFSQNKSPPSLPPPLSLKKEFYHADFMSGSKFVSTVAAVAHINNHYPKITLERRLMRKEKAWRVITTVTCYTETLGGLSFNDFHIAMLVDVESGRTEIQKLLLLDEEDSFRKHV